MSSLKSSCMHQAFSIQNKGNKHQGVVFCFCKAEAFCVAKQENKCVAFIIVTEPQEEELVK